jgi:hypothetical protein
MPKVIALILHVKQADWRFEGLGPRRTVFFEWQVIIFDSQSGAPGYINFDTSLGD